MMSLVFLEEFIHKYPNTAKAIMTRGYIVLLKIKRLDLFGDQRYTESKN